MPKKIGTGELRVKQRAMKSGLVKRKKQNLAL